MLNNNKISNNSATTIIKTSNKRSIKPDTGFRDINSNKIRIGDTVGIITQGKFNSTRGTVISVKERRLSIKDTEGTEITRAPHNLILKKEEDTDITSDNSDESVDSDSHTSLEEEWKIKGEVEEEDFL